MNEAHMPEGLKKMEQGHSPHSRALGPPTLHR